MRIKITENQYRRFIGEDDELTPEDRAHMVQNLKRLVDSREPENMLIAIETSKSVGLEAELKEILKGYQDLFYLLNYIDQYDEDDLLEGIKALFELEHIVVRPLVTKFRIPVEEIIADIAKFPNIVSLEFGALGLIKIPPQVYTMTHLKELDLSFGNNITEISEDISNLKNLTNLDLYGNSLTKLPKGIGNLTQLKTLGLQHNDLTEIPDEIAQLTNLRWLLAFGNLNLVKIPKNLSGLTKLAFLNLDDTGLTTFPMQVQQLKSLRKLHIKGTLISDREIARAKKELKSTNPTLRIVRY